MWATLDNAAVSLSHDGWTRCTAYWWRKTVNGRDLWLELEWDGKRDYLFPVLHEQED